MTSKARLAGLISIFLPLLALAQEATPPVPEAAEPPAATASTEPELPAEVRVMGIETLNDYAMAIRLLSAAGGRRVDLTEADGSTVTFRVLVRGGSAALERALESSGQLTRSGASSGRLVYELRR